MSAAPRLILKQPTGWLAAGREVAEALALLPDPVFRLYMYLCLNADRHTGRFRIDPLFPSVIGCNGFGCSNCGAQRYALFLHQFEKYRGAAVTMLNGIHPCGYSPAHAFFSGGMYNNHAPAAFGNLHGYLQFIFSKRWGGLFFRSPAVICIYFYHISPVPYL